MATTTNYGWETPDDTDLVKDGAAAIRTLGNSVDTTTKNLNPETTLGDLAYRSATSNVNTRLALGSALQVLRVNSGGTAPEWATTADQTPLTTKGDLFTFTTVDARLGIGANNTVLTADSAEATGMKWAAPAGANASYSLLNSGGTALTGADTITVSGISGMNKLHLFIKDMSTVGASPNIGVRFNGDTSGLYQQGGIRLTGASVYSKTYSAAAFNETATFFFIAVGSDNADYTSYGSVWVDGANSTGHKFIDATVAVDQGSGVNGKGSAVQGMYRGTSAISSVSLFSSSSNFDSGTLFVYGSAI